ncbi:MAG: 1,4-dihydroxy-2-naphthoate octaprenyltransferase [Armatimonadetes bacterium]|nr:1,4-dihydroxy-2-naphthoate octaprenyltransferase [Armatimonadota bacterium]
MWWRAVRPASFTASATPVLVGAAAAGYGGTFSTTLFAVTLIASVAIHAGTNLANDYYDHVRGVDTPDSPGPSGVIQRGLLSPRSVLRAAFVLFGLGSLLGLWLVIVRGWPILVIGVLGVLAGYAYTGGPLPLGYVGLGDLVVFALMGMATVAGTYFVLTGSISPTAVWAALPVAALVTAILVANNLRDLPRRGQTDARNVSRCGGYPHRIPRTDRRRVCGSRRGDCERCSPLPISGHAADPTPRGARVAGRTNGDRSAGTHDKGIARQCAVALTVRPAAGGGPADCKVIRDT